MLLLLVALGGAAGALSRYGIGLVVQRSTHTTFPWATLAVNVIGCILVGALARLFWNAPAHSQLRALLIVGFCGGFTTFSAFSLETVSFLQNGEWPKAAAYAAASLITCVLGTAIGFAIVRPL